MKRREFVRNIGLGSAVMAGTGLPNLAWGAAPGAEIFVLVFLRGGMDGLHLCAPASDRTYTDARSADLRVGTKETQLLKNPLNGLDFCLNEAAKPFKELYDSNRLAIIHACGLTNGTRSHFEAMDLIERGIQQKKSTAQGWLARYLAGSPLANGPLPALGMGDGLPVSLWGGGSAVSLASAAEFTLRGDPRVAGILRSWYQQDAPLDRTAQQMLKTAQLIQGKLPRDANGQVTNYQPAAEYPGEWYVQGLREQLKNLARLIKMDAGVHVATADFGGWDTHEAQAYHFPQLMTGLAGTIGAFYNDLTAYHPRLTILIMSEFGRRLKANRSGGTDHGLGNVMLAIGQNVRGGRMYGNWPGLATEQLDNGVDLAVTTDYRTVLSEILAKRMGNPNLGPIFPDFKPPALLNFMT
jgi:uncharacterized protein (DUF1501 family)